MALDIDPGKITDLESAIAAIRELLRLVAQQERQIEQLRRELEEAKRAGKRQAAPFSKGEPKEVPKRPGRKAGHTAAHRAAPEKIDRVMKASLQERCGCGGRIVQDDEKAQYQTDIPRPIPLTTTRFDVAIGHCQTCGKRHQGKHPEQTSDALGAAGVQMGPNVLALASELKHKHGMSYGAFAGLLQRLTNGLRFSRAAFARADQRVAAVLQPTCDALIERMRKQDVAYVDETGWRINGRSAWLWAFTSADIAVFVIEPGRDHTVVERLLGCKFKGVLKSDCLRTYDSVKLAGIEKSKCLAHLMRRARQTQDAVVGRAKALGGEVAKLFRQAINLKQAQHALPRDEIEQRRQALECWLDRLLASHYRHAENVKLQKLLRKQRPHLLNFLDHTSVDATNNLAERTLRPSVIIRKTNGCNRSPVGAYVHQTIASVLVTWERQGVNAGMLIAGLLRVRGNVALDFSVSLGSTR